MRRDNRWIGHSGDCVFSIIERETPGGRKELSWSGGAIHGKRVSRRDAVKALREDIRKFGNRIESLDDAEIEAFLSANLNEVG